MPIAPSRVVNLGPPLLTRLERQRGLRQWPIRKSEFLLEVAFPRLVPIIRSLPNWSVRLGRCVSNAMNKPRGARSPKLARGCLFYVRKKLRPPSITKEDDVDIGRVPITRSAFQKRIDLRSGHHLVRLAHRFTFSHSDLEPRSGPTPLRKTLSFQTGTRQVVGGGGYRRPREGDLCQLTTICTLSRLIHHI